MSTTQQQLAGLSPAKRELLLAKLAKRSAATVQGQEPIRPRDPSPELLPLSFAQERLWFLDQFEPDSRSYNIYRALRWRGALNTTALRESVDKVVQRHETLRSKFVATQGKVAQIIGQEQTSDALIEVNLDHHKGDSQERELQRLLVEHSQHSFKLASGPLLRVVLLRLAEDDHVLLLVVHHIVFDGWSMGIFFQELFSLYMDISCGSPLHLSELPIQYPDYAVWQRERLRGEKLERLNEYWKKQLAGAPPFLDLATDYPRPHTQTFNGDSESCRLSPALSEALRSLGQQNSATLFMVMLAAFNTLLRQYSGQEDLLVGTPVSGRTRPETENIIGLFVNTLVVRTKLSGDPTFLEILRRVRETTLAAYSHQELPFERLVDVLKVKRNLAYSPIFQVMLSMQNMPAAAPDNSGFQMEPVEIARPTALFDLQLTIVQPEGNVGLILEYNRDLFARSTVAALLAQFQFILAQVAAFPRKHISEYPVMIATGPEKRLTPKLPMEAASAAGEAIPAKVEIKLAAQTMSNALRQAQNSRSTIDAVMLTVWQILLWRLMQQPEVAIAHVFGNAELPAVIPIRNNFSATSTFASLLETVKAQYHDAGEWFQFLNQNELTGIQSASLAIRFLYRDQQTDELSASSRQVGIEIKPGKLQLEVSNTKPICNLLLHYDAARYAEQDVACLLAQYVTLLQSALEGPEVPISELEISSPAHQKMLREFHGAGRSFPESQCIHELFELQAARTPDAEAAVCGDQSLSYGELNAQANQVARYLRELGAGPDVKISLCLERSLGMLVAILGVLKAGSAYVPMDPSYPQERLAWMLEDTQAPVVITTRELRGSLPETAAQVIELDTAWPQITEQSKQNLGMIAAPENAAYVIYTSGSTGKPKGVVVEHSGIVRIFAATQHWTRLNEKDVLALFHSYSFDVSVFEIWAAWLFGGTLVVVTWIESRSPELLCELLSRHKVTVLCQTPSAFRHLIQANAIQTAPPDLSVRMVIFAGEALNPSIVAPWLERYPKTEMVNMYGITETSVYNTFKRLSPLDVRQSERSPIGVPFPDQRIYILNDRLQECGLWENGEIYLAGAGLAREYLNRPELTAERFLPDVYGSTPGARMYRSGDKGRWNGEGELEFVGRMDNQVKVRGYRIELGEVERAVQEQGGVAQAAVVVKERVGGERQLIAYVEMAEGSSGDAVGRVRAGVRERLPEYMCPAQYVRMERIPRTASGKLDRKALPEPEVAGERGQEYVAPRNEVERRLLEIWETVLGSQGIGVKDNFFEVGGDSIVGIQIVARARQAGLELTPKQLFQYQSIAELAEQAGRGSEVVEAEQGEVRGAGPLTPIQRWFMEQHGVKARHYNQAFLFRVKAETRLEWLEEALEKLVEQHDSLRMRVEQNEGEWEQSYAGVAESGVRVKRVDLSGSKGAEQEEQLREVVRREQESLDIERGPVAGIVLVELGEEKGRRLLMVVHHMAVDGVSWRIMLEDVANWYGQRERGEQISGGRKTTSFKQWAEKLQEYGKSEKAEAERTYWAGEEARAVEELAMDYESGENRFGDEGRVVEVLEAETTRELLSEAGKAYNTQVMDLLLGALVEGLWEWGGYERVRVELEGHGREDVVKGVDLTRTVGWFTSLYPVVLERRVGESVGARIQRVKEQLREVPEKGIGYGVLRYGRSQSQQPAAAITKTAAETVAAVEKRKGEGELLINYLGQFDRSLGEEALLQGAREGSGAPVGAEQQRSAKVEMNALVIGGQLQMAWSYSRQQYKPETIAKLAQHYLLSLRDLIRHCTSTNDFAGVDAYQFDIDYLAAKVDMVSE